MSSQICVRGPKDNIRTKDMTLERVGDRLWLYDYLDDGIELSRKDEEKLAVVLKKFMDERE